MNIPVIPADNVSIQLEQIGVGGFGHILRGYWKSKKMHVAIKITKDIAKEAEIWMTLHHKYIIKFFGILNQGSVRCMVLELAENGSLHHFLDPARENTLIDHALRWAFDVASGVQYLHGLNIIHRDLKSQNVVITAGMLAKLCDFGTSRTIDKSTVVTMAGSVPWMSPEIIAGKGVNKLTDSWSFGVLLWEVLIRETPYVTLKGPSILFYVGSKRLRLNLPDDCPESIARLVRRCMKFKRRSRPTFEDVPYILLRVNCERKSIQKFMKKKPKWKDFEKYTITGDRHQR